MSNRRMFWGVTVGLALLPGVAHAWWNEEWTGRKPLQIDTSPAGGNITDAIGTAPVLVRLHMGSFKFEAAKEDGSDLRFIAADDRTPLKHHFEKYDPLIGEAAIWVGVPDLKPGTRTSIWLYFGNPKAAIAEDSKGTYDPSTTLVYHFAESGQPPRDSSVWGSHAANGAASADALIGRGLRLDGTVTIGIPAVPSLAWSSGAKMTWSAWIKPAEADSSGIIFSRRDDSRSFVIGLENGKPFVQLERGRGIERAGASDAIQASSWHHLAIAAGDAIALYVDGIPAAKLAAVLPALNTAAYLGSDGDAAAVSLHADQARAAGKSGAKPPPRLPGFSGDLDELQIAKVERPVGFIRFAAIAQGTDPGKLLVAGQDEETASSSGGYFAVIIKSVTPDGWVVIGLLAIMSLVSWLVMASKAIYLGSVERSNEYFRERFQQASTDLARLVGGAVEASELGDAKLLGRSPLYRLFRVSIAETGKRMAARDGSLSAEAIEAIRASLDAGLVRENQKLTKKMVLLTIAISGGPFLGLLGTVVGVMITFAAIAAAGDVNVNAIAPGIAAALVATVAGLAVAIPALFGYNWLLTRIKNVTATLQVFVDELVANVAETFSERAPSELRTPQRPAVVGME